MTKKIIYLSLKDLKELGVIKKRRRKRVSKTKILSNAFTTNKPTPSDHMTGYTQYFNTSNLQTDLLHNQNRQLALSNESKELDIKNTNTITNDVNSKLLQLERQQNNQQNNYYYTIGEMAKNNYNIDRNMGFKVDDNIDVPSTYPDENLLDEGTSTPEVTHHDEIIPQHHEENIPQQTEEPQEIIPVMTKKEKNNANRDNLKQLLKDEGYTGDTSDINNQTDLKTLLTEHKKKLSTLKGKYITLGGENKKVLE